MIDLGGAVGYDPNRTLPFRVEVRRQIKRRRTVGVFAFMAGLPLILMLAFAVGNPAPSARGVNLIDVATDSGLNFVLFVFFVTTGFFLVVIFALFFGDTIASEASWGSLRYLLALPVPRARLLTRKLLVALTMSLASLVVLVVVSIVAGTLAYGWKPISTPVGIQLSQGTALLRVIGICGYVAVSMIMVGALAFMLSVWTDAPLAAVGGTVLIVIVSQILNQVDALGDIRNWLPAHYNTAWIGLLSDPPDTADMVTGIGFTAAYSAVFVAVAYWHFTRKDVVS